MSGDKNLVDLRSPLPFDRVEKNGLEVELLNPKLSDKFSPNLYRYLKRNKVCAEFGRVYRDVAGILWLGYEDDPFMCVTRLMEVLCRGVKASSSAYTGLGNLSEITDFWTQYLEVGRCSIDPSHERHFLEGERYVLNGDSRECLWCGCKQQLHRWTESVEKSEWRVESAFRKDIDLKPAD